MAGGAREFYSSVKRRRNVETVSFHVENTKTSSKLRLSLAISFTSVADVRGPQCGGESCVQKGTGRPVYSIKKNQGMMNKSWLSDDTFSSEILEMGESTSLF